MLISLKIIDSIPIDTCTHACIAICKILYWISSVDIRGINSISAKYEHVHNTVFWLRLGVNIKFNYHKCYGWGYNLV